MSNQYLKLRRSAVPSKIPTTESIDFGEIALNTYDGLAFMKKSGSNGEEVVTIGSTTGAFTGSFSGSFTGSLFGTSSYSISSSYTSTASYASFAVSSSYADNAGNAYLLNQTSSGVFATTGSNIFTGDQTITGSNGRLIYTGTPSGAYPTLAEIHANNDFPWLERFYNDTFSTSSAVVAYYGHNDGRFVFHNESTQSIGLQVNGFSGENGLLVYSDKVAFVNNVEVTGSLNVVGGITGSLQGTSSWATNALTASYVNPLNQNVIITGSLIQGLEGNIATGEYSHAEGSITKAIGNYSHAEGDFTQAVGDYSHAEGQETITSGSYSHAEGYSTTARGQSSHAEGSTTLASGDYSHAEGNNTIASGSYSHAEGQNTRTIGNFSHAEGDSTISQGNGSHAEGLLTLALGLNSHAEGLLTTASANYSHAEGQQTQAIGEASHAEGLGTVALGSYQHVQGQYNISSSVQSAFIVGNGTNDANRSNLIFAAGNAVQITGSLGVTQGITGSLFGTASWANNALTASSADNFTVRGTLTAQTIVAQTITSSTEFITGSTKFGSLLSNTHEFTGSVSITGSLTAANANISGSFSGSLSNLQGTPTHIAYFSSSQVLADSAIFQVDNGPGEGFSIAINQNAVTTANPEALYVSQIHPTSFNIISGKGNLDNYAQLNIFNTNAGTNASADVVATANNGNETTNYIDMGINNENYSGSIGIGNDAYLYSTGRHLHIGNTTNNPVILFAGGDDTDIYRKLQIDPNNQHQLTGSLDISGSLIVRYGITGSLLGTASFANNSTSASYALTASFARNAASASYVLNAVSSSFASTASFVENAQSASYVLNAVSSSYSATASYLESGATSSYSISSSYALTASYVVLAQTASYVTLAETASYVTLAQTASYALQAVSASYSTTASYVENAQTASYVLNAISASYATTASFVQNAQTASYVLNAVSASYVTLSQTASYVETAQTASYVTLAQTASYVLQAISASYAISSSQAQNASTASYVLQAISASYAISASQAEKAVTASYADNFTVAGTLTVQTIVAQTITSSTEFVTGSTKFGTLLTNTHQFTGSVSMTGSLSVNNSNVILSNQTSSMSVATASYVLNAVSASYAATASYVENAQTASYVTLAQTASYVLQAVSASYATSASQAQTASYVNALNQNVIITGSVILSGSQTISGSLIVTQGLTGSLFGTASWAFNAQTASYLINGATASYALTASYVETAQTASYVLQAVSASYALTASYVPSIKALSGSVASFFGTPFSSSVTFASPYATNLYAVSVIGEDLRAWSVSDKTTTGFTINSNSSVSLTGPIYWIATPFNG